MNKTRIFTAAPLGSIPELPAMSCLEIRQVKVTAQSAASTGWIQQALGGQYWLTVIWLAGVGLNLLYKLFLPQNYININFISITTICLVSISFSVDTLLISFYLSHGLHFKFLDKDECKYNINECDLNTNCINTYGSYKCTCKRDTLAMDIHVQVHLDDHKYVFHYLF